MISIDQALQLILDNAVVRPTCTLPLSRAVSRILANDAISDIDSPPFDKSLMDGYALRSEDITAGNQTLSVTEFIPAGAMPTCPITSGTAAKIMTGAPLPEGANTVVVVEETQADEDSATVRVLCESVQIDRHILRQGTCMRKGQVVLRRGARLNGGQLGLLAESGNDPVEVNTDVRVAVVATGNELVPSGQPVDSGQIRNSNGPMLRGLAEQAGARVSDLGIARDDLTELRDTIRKGLAADILLLSGGVSAGDLDLVPQVLRESGVREIFHKVNIKPGKPLWFGRCEDTLVFGLPGNPVSSSICYQIFVRPAIARLCGQAVDGPRFGFRQALLDGGHAPRGNRTTFFPARYLSDGSQVVVSLLPWQGSADLRTVAVAECLVELPAGVAIRDCGEVNILDIR